jgi:8-oxo-dGTP pyrophosphatase MutT (NUDIX family)
MAKFRRVESERVLQYRMFELYRHAMADEEGQRGHDVFTFAFPDWVSVVPVTRDGSFVLVRQHRHGVDAPTLETPGGVIDAGEDPVVAAEREMREETGFGGGTLISLGVTHPNPVLQGNRHHMFLARGVERVGKTHFDTQEHCELVVVGADEMRARVREGAITHALVLLSLSRAFELLDRERNPSPVLHSLDEVEALLAKMEELQAKKVIDLARRLRPGLTAEDIRNPHDFPELDDTDWHFEDGQLAGLQSVATALRALRSRTNAGDA